MTPILFGRWQTRIFLLATIGVLFSLPFYLGFLGDSPNNPVYFWVLLYIGIFGLFWDLLYNYLQQFLWDFDWPGVLQFVAGVAEGLLLMVVIKFIGLPQVPASEFNLITFIQQYSLVWVALYLSSWVVMRILFPRWRFRGGAWIGKWNSSSS